MAQSKAAKAKEAQTNAIERLREMFPTGAYVSTVIRSVSSSGMTRGISVLHTEEDGCIYDVSHLVARAVGRPLHRTGGVKCVGVGMDMAWDLAYNLSHALYGDGYALRHYHV